MKTILLSSSLVLVICYLFFAACGKVDDTDVATLAL